MRMHAKRGGVAPLGHELTVKKVCVPNFYLSGYSLLPRLEALWSNAKTGRVLPRKIFGKIEPSDGIKVTCSQHEHRNKNRGQGDYGSDVQPEGFQNRPKN